MQIRCIFFKSTGNLGSLSTFISLTVSPNLKPLSWSTLLKICIQNGDVFVCQFGGYLGKRPLSWKLTYFHLQIPSCMGPEEQLCQFSRLYHNLNKFSLSRPTFKVDPLFIKSVLCFKALKLYFVQDYLIWSPMFLNR